MANKNNTTVVLNLDRPRFLRFGHKALKKMTMITNMKIESMDEGDFNLEDVEKILWCGLLEDAKEHGEELKLEDMEDILDKAERYGDIMAAMQAALAEAFKATEKEKN
jgi:hypothetical protein